MWKVTFLAGLLVMSCGASAQPMRAFGPMDAGDVCYSWGGDTRTSAGTFSRCNPVINLQVAAAPPVVKEVVREVPAPMMSCPPPVQTPIPTKKKYRKPPVKC